MARYFMQLRSGTEELLDPEGSEYPNITALREAVLFIARDVLTADIRLGVIDLRFRIDAEDEAGTIVHSLGFEDAVSVRTMS